MSHKFLSRIDFFQESLNYIKEKKVNVEGKKKIYLV